MDSGSRSGGSESRNVQEYEDRNWNPAWRPNHSALAAEFFTADSLDSHSDSQPSDISREPASKAPQVLDSNLDLQSSLSQDAPALQGQPTPQTSQVFIDKVDSDDHRVNECEQQDNSSNKIGDLRNALSRSLAGPGGVEMDESPNHKDQVSSDISASTANLQSSRGHVGKAEFPSSRPSHDRPTEDASYPHSATLAGDAPQGLSWGDEDAPDSTGDVNPSSLSPRDFMGETGRTNSFPEVPPVHHPNDPHVDDQTQTKSDTTKPVEMINERDKFGREPVTEDAMDRSHGSFNGFGLETADQQAGLSGLPEPSDNRTTDDLSTLGRQGVLTPPDEEARFEEGLPLVPQSSGVEGHSQDIDPSVEVNQSPINPFGDSHDDMDEDIFSSRDNGQLDDHSQPPQALQRKSTPQVLGSLGYPPRHQNHGSETKQAPQGPSTSTTGGGIAVSTSTVISQVLSEAQLTNGTQGSNERGQAKPEQQDLAAMWKAALDDDEFLDDGEEAVDPAGFFPDDGEDFLDEEAKNDHQTPLSPPVPTPVIGEAGEVQGFSNLSNTITRVASSQSSPSRYTPTASQQPQQPQQPPNQYSPSGAQFPNMASSAQPQPSWGQQTAHSGALFPDTGNAQPSPFLPTQQASPPGWAPQSQNPAPRPDSARAQSFADKSKGGYASPYDLPMDVTRPRKRASMQQMAKGLNSHVPGPQAPLPARASSMNVNDPPHGTRPLNQPPLSQGSTPYSSSPAIAQRPTPQPDQVRPSSTNTGTRPTMTGAGNSFFEDLPMTTKPRHTSGSGRYDPQQGMPTAPTRGTVPRPELSTMQQQAQYPQQQQVHPPPTMEGQVSNSSIPLAADQLRPPERVNPYALGLSSSSGGPVPPPSNASRYSPAPPPQVGQQTAAKYAAAGGGPTPPPPRPHQPRTSSPLAYHSKSSDGTSHHPSLPRTASHQPSQYGTEPWSGNLVQPARRSTDGEAPLGQQAVTSGGESTESAALNRYAPGAPSATPPPSVGTSANSFSPPKRVASAYTSQQQVDQPLMDPSLAPPRRPRTQSPRAMGGPGLSAAWKEQHVRPGLDHEQASAQYGAGGYAPMNAGSAVQRLAESRQDLNYIAPTDGRDLDPFQRWRGCPVFSWGFGGTIVTTFPKEVQRYSTGQAFPMVKCSPGEVRTRSVKEVFPLEEYLSTFPGPLKGKGKKKEVVIWLDLLVAHYEKRPLMDPSSLTDGKRNDEKILLCKVLRTLIEHDGVLDGHPDAEQAVRKVLAPELQDDQTDRPTYTTGIDQRRRSSVATPRIQPDSVDPTSVDQLKEALLRGDREKAVWQAVDKRLWGHAMLISSTLSREVWKQVVQEFVRQEVKKVSDNTESLAALYEVFAGNYEESIDELVPPSARAGFQMISKTADQGPTIDALQGLDKWKETLGMILGNRSNDDGQALMALGRLLLGYGRVEAAHTCYMFARAHSFFGGSDDPQSSIALLGVNHSLNAVDQVQNLEAILLSEVYEFGLSLSTSSPVSAVVPHLQAHKLHHAMVLAEYGYRTEAQNYCEAIYGSIKATTRPSPYYHALLTGSLDDLTKRLLQSPKDNSSSWISKPTMGKISGSLATKFTSFVVGDDSDAASTGSGRDGSAEVGPFAKVAGGTPVISRSPSYADLYGSYGSYGSGDSYHPLNPGASSPAESGRPSKYAPASPYAPRAVSDQLRSSNEAIRPAMSYATHQSGSYTPSYAQQPESRISPGLTQEGHSGTLQPGHDRFASAPASYSPNVAPQNESASLYAPSSYQPTLPLEPTDLSGGNGTAPATHAPAYMQASSYDARSFPCEESEQAASAGYEPPSGNSYEPPSYQPYQDDAQNGDVSPEGKTKKKSFMDDDDDYSAVSMKSSQNDKAAKDKEAEKSFKKAAAADAARDQQSGEKKGWFGGWFGKKDPNAAPGPIKAKLGEESSFHYDPVLKKWVNKKAGDTGATPASATPPPPKGPPSRAVSGSAPPPSSTTTARPLAPASTPSPPVPTSNPTLPPSNLSSPPITAGSARPGLAEPTNLSASPSLAPPAPGLASGPPSRPPSTMSAASSIDDLLGQPVPRKGGTMKKNKKGRGYVDVMAK